jgi:hypothetical protein
VQPAAAGPRWDWNCYCSVVDETFPDGTHTCKDLPETKYAFSTCGEKKAAADEASKKCEEHCPPDQRCQISLSGKADPVEDASCAAVEPPKGPSLPQGEILYSVECECFAKKDEGKCVSVVKERVGTTSQDKATAQVFCESHCRSYSGIYSEKGAYCKSQPLMSTLQYFSKAAQDCPLDAKVPTGTICYVNPLGTTRIPKIVGNILNAALGLLGSISLLMFIYGGVTWVTSGGATERVQKGKNIVTWAVLGLLLVFSSYALLRFVLGAFTGI